MDLINRFRLAMFDLASKTSKQSYSGVSEVPLVCWI